MARSQGEKKLAGYTPKAGFVFILGMHRSGTSCLAGSLELCGLFLGDVSRSNWHNVKGNHELKAIIRVHDQILAGNGGAWHKPPARITVNVQHEQILKKIVKHLTDHCPCGIKDPRLLLLLDIWTEMVDSYTLVGTFRHPVAVAQSLARRDQMPGEQACNLWLKYNTELIRWHKLYQFPLIEFDLSDIKAYRRTITVLAKMLGLEPDIKELQEFISVELEHYQVPREPIPDTCRKTYAYLKQHRHHCYF